MPKRWVVQGLLGDVGGAEAKGLFPPRVVGAARPLPWNPQVGQLCSSTPLSYSSGTQKSLGWPGCGLSTDVLSLVSTRGPGLEGACCLGTSQSLPNHPVPKLHDMGIGVLPIFFLSSPGGVTPQPHPLCESFNSDPGSPESP